MCSISSSPEKARKLVRWADSSKLEDGLSEQPNTLNTTEEPRSDLNSASKREDWYGGKLQRLKDHVEILRNELQLKERDYLRVKNKYKNLKNRQIELQDELQKHKDRKLDLDSDVEFLRLQLLEKDNQLSKYAETGFGHFENIKFNIGADNNEFIIQYGGIQGNRGIEKDEENIVSDDSLFSKKYLSLHQDARKFLTYVLVCVAMWLVLVAMLKPSAYISTLAVGLWTIILSFVWFERNQRFKTFKLQYLTKIHRTSMANSRLKMETFRLESRLSQLTEELTDEKHKCQSFVSRQQATAVKLGEEMAKNEELVKLEKSTFEELQGERVRRRRAEEQLEEVSAQLLLAREKDDIAKQGDVCQELRNNLRLERETKETLSRENERLIKEIVQMDLSQEKERLKHEISHQTCGLTVEAEKTREKSGDKIIKREAIDQVSCLKDERNLRYTSEKLSTDGLKNDGNDGLTSNETKKDASIVSGEDVKGFDCKDCESANGLGNQNSPCWLNTWSIFNQTSLALLIVIGVCLMFMLKVVSCYHLCILIVFMLLVLAGCFVII